MTLMALLLTAGVHAWGDSGARARKQATGEIVSLVEQARATALASRCVVALALAEPGDLAPGDERGLIGIFKIKEWPTAGEVLEGTLIRRWQALPSGVVILPGAFDGVRNPCDGPETNIRYRAGNQIKEARFHILAFSPRGGLQWPTGSEPVALRIAEGAYRNGKPEPNNRGSARAVAENVLKIGRVTARPYPFDR